ncbi:LOW QUALITY PROTEIN: hypothetical protein M8C21_001086 [Ambrosia artemisiifolia]|uniref:Uncharacterized protein n=1 Tax=Ambrosia artemisiifolia TaxID=4212 RepID=A0AAD5BRY7_AMBAR|nr:LOW QUALITY PROTEIN: hypothetical protein M8C21_001086 [Ambrosia artemisiifolia]
MTAMGVYVRDLLLGQVPVKFLISSGHFTITSLNGSDFDLEQIKSDSFFMIHMANLQALIQIGHKTLPIDPIGA